MAQDMTQDSENPAIWTLTVDEFKVDALNEGETERQYEYKAAANHAWGQYELPAQGNQNWKFGSEMYPADKTYKLVFTADTENHVLTLEVTEQTSTAISELNADDAAKVVFNLQGQRMQNAQKGLYIINGQKVIVK